jgi:cyanophycinase-like exopeptidase
LLSATRVLPELAGLTDSSASGESNTVLTASATSSATGLISQTTAKRFAASATATPLGEKAALLVPTSWTDVHFFWNFPKATVNKDEVGFFYVDGPDGRITLRTDGDPDGAPLLDADGLPQYVRPGDPDYAATALAAANSQVVFALGEVHGTKNADTIVTVPWDGYIAFYVVADSTTDEWRQAVENNDPDVPNVWFSLGAANQDGYEHFQLTSPRDCFYRRGILQYKVEDASAPIPRARAYNDVVFSVNIVPYATGDDYSVFNAGADFSGQPVGFRADAYGDAKNQGFGLLGNDYDAGGRKLTITAVSVDDEATWQRVFGARTYRSASLHGTLTVFANGGFRFLPDRNDPYWYPEADDEEPDPVYFKYRASDGIDSSEAWVSITHGYYHAGAAMDNAHQGQPMYFLAGGGDETPFEDGLQKFFVEGSAGQDIVVIAQGAEQKEMVDYVFTDLAGGYNRSVVSLNVTTREQANDPRLAAIVDGADAIWFGGGAQSLYQRVWAGTRLFAAIARAAASDVAIGGTSAGMAILGQVAYVDLVWDYLHSPFTEQNPLDPRVNLVSQGDGRLPFAALSDSAAAPLYNLVTDTHFAVRNRMGRLATFAARASTNGLGVDEGVALLMEPTGSGWAWTVYGDGCVYLITPGTDAEVRYEDQQRLTFGPIAVYRLTPETTVSADPAEVLSQDPTYQIWVLTGTIYTTENGGELY